MGTAINGQLELTIKIDTMPERTEPLGKGAQAFWVESNGVRVRAKLSKKSFKKLQQGANEYGRWLAVMQAPVQLIGGHLEFVSTSGAQVIDRTLVSGAGDESRSDKSPQAPEPCRPAATTPAPKAKRRRPQDETLASIEQRRSTQRQRTNTSPYISSFHAPEFFE